MATAVALKNKSSTIKGIVLIFNGKYFNTLKTRVGTNKDAENITSTFENLHYEVQRYNDLQVFDIQSKVEEATTSHYNKNKQILIVFVLTHGSRGNGQRGHFVRI